MSYASLASLKIYLGIALDVTGEDALLTRLLNAATAAIDGATGRVFAAAMDTTRRFGRDEINGRTLYLDHDLAQLTSVVNGTGVAIPLLNIATMPRNAAPYFALITRNGAAWAWTDADSEIVITGRWAYSVAPPADIEQACIRLAGYFYRVKDAQVFEVTANPETGQMNIAKGLPADVETILKPYRRLL